MPPTIIIKKTEVLETFDVKKKTWKDRSVCLDVKRIFYEKVGQQKWPAQRKLGMRGRRRGALLNKAHLFIYFLKNLTLCSKYLFYFFNPHCKVWNKLSITTALKNKNSLHIQPVKCTTLLCFNFHLKHHNVTQHKQLTWTTTPDVSGISPT